MGLGILFPKKGCIYSSKCKRCNKNDLTLYFYLASTFQAPVVSYLNIVRATGRGKSTPQTGQEAKLFLWYKSLKVVTVCLYCEQIWIRFRSCLHKWIHLKLWCSSKWDPCLTLFAHTHYCSACVCACVRMCRRSSSGWRSLEYSVLDSCSLCFLCISKSTHRSSVYST